MWSWFKKKRHRTLLDSFALLDSGKWNAIENAIRGLQKKAQPTLLVAHFPSTFTWIQSQLENSELSYSLTKNRISETDLLKLLRNTESDSPLLDSATLSPEISNSPSLFLILAEQLVLDSEAISNPCFPESESERDFSVIVCERHPVEKQDFLLKRFIGRLPGKSEIGYFLSLEEPLIRAAIGDNAVLVMQQLGLNEHELITSQILTRRIDRFTKKQNDLETKSADSPADWLKINAHAPAKKQNDNT